MKKHGRIRSQIILPSETQFSDQPPKREPASLQHSEEGLVYERERVLTRKSRSAKRLSVNFLSGDLLKGLSSLKFSQEDTPKPAAPPDDSNNSNEPSKARPELSVFKVKSFEKQKPDRTSYLSRVNSCSSLGKIAESSNKPRNFKLGRKLNKKSKRSSGNSPLIYSSHNSGKISSKSDVSKQTLCTEILFHVFTLMGIESDDKDELINTILESSNISQIYSHLYTREEMKTTQTLSRRVKLMIKQQEKQKAAIKIQSLARGFLVRNRLRKIDEKEMERIKKFNKFYISLVACEEKYVKILKMLQLRYIRPLRQRISLGKEVLSADEISFIFCNLERLLSLHQTTVEKLKNLTNSWPYVNGVGKVLLDMEDELQGYGIYVGNFKAAQATLLQLKAENTKFSTWLQETAQQYTDAMDLLTLLSVPLSHLEYMEPILENLGQHSLTGVEEENIKNAYSMINQARSFVKAHLVQSDVNMSVTNVERRITGVSEPLHLVKPGRQLLNETVFNVGNSNSKLSLLFFTDLLLICKPAKGSIKNGPLKFIEQSDLDTTRFETILRENLCFNIHTKANTYKLQGRYEDLQLWEYLFKNYRDRQRKNPTFGIDLLSLIEQENSPDRIPSILRDCISQIQNTTGGLALEGIFRISADQRELSELKSLFDNKTSKERDLSSYSVHAICGILKQWLRELPDPLLTHELYSKFISLERKFDYCISLTPEMISELQNLIAKLGPRLPTLKFLIEFLVSVCANQQVNKMTENNIAIVFAPTILRPRVETMETTLNLPIANQVICRFLHHHDQLFT